MTDAYTLLEQHTMPTYKRWPVEFVSGSGARLVDVDGKEYVDLVAGIAVAGVGHANERVARAVAEQVSRLVHVSNLYATRPGAELAERLARLTGGMQSFFTNSGAEAIECAIKLARRWGGPDRFRVVCTDGGFHGRTLGALAATGQPAKQEPFLPLPGGFTHVPYGDAEALEAVVSEDVCAILIEPVQGEAGVIVPPADYLDRARRAADEAGCLLVFDEIQTGLGRTGKMFAYEHGGVTPDVLCLAKALAGGLPMGACLARSEVAKAFSAGDHGTTFGGGPVIAAAALATLDEIEQRGLVARAESLGRRIAGELREMAPPGATVRGLGLMLGVALADDSARAVAEAALEAGVLVNDCGPSVVRLVPPLVITDDEVDVALDVLRSVFGRRS